jgi:hypothetical protein
MNGGKVYHSLDYKLNNNLIKIIQQYNTINILNVKYNKYIVIRHLSRILYKDCYIRTIKFRIVNYYKYYINHFNEHKVFYKQQFMNEKIIHKL